MEEKILKKTLEQLGQQAFPDDTDPWTPIQNRLVKDPAVMRLKQAPTYPVQHRLLRLRLLLVSVVALTLLAAILLLTPGGEALAETLRHFFRPVSVEEFPTPPSEALATPTFAPTFAVTLVSVQEATPVSTPTPDPRSSAQGSTSFVTASPVPTGFSPSGLSDCNTDLYGYTCRIAQAEKAAGFDAKEFPVDPPGFHFKTAHGRVPNAIWMEYIAIGGGGYLYLSQGLGSDFLYSGAAEESAIETVQVGDHIGEYLFGDYAYGGVYGNRITWVNCCRARLRWTDGERWYEIDKQAALPQTDYMTKDVMIQMATQLVDQPESVQVPRPDYLKSLEEASQVAEFPFLAPSLLPERFVFDYATYNITLSQLRLFYTPPGAQGTATVFIIETPLEYVSLAPGDNGEMVEGEAVEINGNPGIYFSADPYAHILTWESGELKITMWVYSSEEWYGGSFSKDQVLEIARSMK